MGFGATKKSPPNEDKWVQRQWSLLGLLLGPTFEQMESLLINKAREAPRVLPGIVQQPGDEVQPQCQSSIMLLYSSIVEMACI